MAPPLATSAVSGCASNDQRGSSSLDSGSAEVCSSADRAGNVAGQQVSGGFRNATTTSATSREAGRLQFAGKLELMLSLVSYAVGLGNVWRFPYLAYSYGGGAFLLPYFTALGLLGLPLFVLELGLGQMMRRGTVGVWPRLGLPRLRGVGVAATVATFIVALYYNVVIAWTLYYFARTLLALPSGVLPWSDAVAGFQCPQVKLWPLRTVANDPALVNRDTGLFNETRRGDFWCPSGLVATPSEPGPDYVVLVTRPQRCPARAAAVFWNTEASERSAGLAEFGGISPSMLASYTVAWLLVYLIIIRGVRSIGKAVYVTALLPYFCLFAFLFRALTLPNALVGLRFFLQPDWSILASGEVWLRAASQIFYSLGLGYGGIIAFGSYGNTASDFASDAWKVALINCGTSILAGFVIFPILGYLVLELQVMDPCMSADSLNDLHRIGLSGVGLVFVAVPIAVGVMRGSFFFAAVFFLMLLTLGLGSQLAMMESVVTVISDAGLGRRLPRPALAALACATCYVLGLIFITKAGVYWVQLFDYYGVVLALFFVAMMECCGLMWCGGGKMWETFSGRTLAWTGRRLGYGYACSWKYVCPCVMVVMLAATLLPPWGSVDLLKASDSRPFPEGDGLYPRWSIAIGWLLAVLPLIAFAVCCALPPLAAESDVAAEAEAEAQSPATAADIAESAPGDAS